MNILEKVLTFDNHWTHPDAEFTASQIASSSGYQLYLHTKGTPKSHVNPLENRVSAQVGTGFHLRAEEALKDEDVLTEVSLFGEIAGVKVSGTADVIYDNGLEDIVGDHKTKGTYQMKKFILGDQEDTRIQLSEYAYLYAQKTGRSMATKGEVYLVHMGDSGYWSKADCAKMGVPEKSKVAKYMTVQLELLTAYQVEKLVRERTNPSSKVDCATVNDKGIENWWRCGWCEYECAHRKN